jgi:multiple sugar transport system ATP-binding protein
MIAGLEEISEGEIYIGDRLVNSLEPKDRGIAMVFQNYALYPHMTVFENMAFGLTLRKVRREEIKKRVLEAAEILAIEALLNRKPKALSGGERQRVALGRALVRNPSAFLLDEPLSNLDAQLRTVMRAEISKLHKRLGTTFIYVTHDQTEAMTMGDRIVVMNGGVIQQVETPQNLYNHPLNLFVAGFIGSPPMNFIRAVVTKKDNGYVADASGAILPLPGVVPRDVLSGYEGKTVIVGVKPEDIYPENLIPARASSGDPNKDAIGLVDVEELEMTEMMGAETYMHIRTAAGGLICRVPSSARLPGRNTNFRVAVDSGKACLFDSESGNNLGRFFGGR